MEAFQIDPPEKKFREGFEVETETTLTVTLRREAGGGMQVFIGSGEKGAIDVSGELSRVEYQDLEDYLTEQEADRD